MSRLPYARNLAGRGPGRAEQFPPAIVAPPPAPRRVSWAVLATLAFGAAEAVTITVSAAVWHYGTWWFLVAVFAGNAVAASVFVLWTRRARRR